jgi:uncharacterized protein YdaU (DUF1376 family)
MDTGSAIRNDLSYIHRWLHAESVEEKNAVEFILGEFFLLTANNAWAHRRCDAEIEWRLIQSAAGKRAVQAREARRHLSIDEQPIIHRSSNQNQNQIKTLRQKQGQSLNPGFDRFWVLYPKRVAKQDALAAWRKLQPDTDMLELMCIALQKATWPSDRKFIPHPATWLNGRRWEDEKAKTHDNWRFVT